MNDETLKAASKETPRCHVCGGTDLELAPGYSGFRRVTSDCKPWNAGGLLARCRVCQMVQSPATAAWEAEARRIYEGYTIYHQGGGREQRVFQGTTGASEPRSDRIVKGLVGSMALPARGRILDIGCGNGAFLSAWQRAVPGWSLTGTEVSDKYRAEVESIPGAERLHTGDLASLPGDYDVISLIHVFEHVPGPLGFLEAVREKLAPEGVLLIEVPDCEENPFMLLVADHCSHFAPALLAGVVEHAGFQAVAAEHRWVSKEISLTATRGPGGRREGAPALSKAAADRVLGGHRVLETMLERVRQVAARPTFGLFGTAIAATWLDAQLGGAARFFVDEDPNRIGRTHLGRPIVGPREVPEGATVFVGLPGALAAGVAERLRGMGRGWEVLTP